MDPADVIVIWAMTQTKSSNWKLNSVMVWSQFLVSLSMIAGTLMFYQVYLNCRHFKQERKRNSCGMDGLLLATVSDVLEFYTVIIQSKCSAYICQCILETKKKQNKKTKQKKKRKESLAYWKEFQIKTISQCEVIKILTGLQVFIHLSRLFKSYLISDFHYVSHSDESNRSSLGL